MKFWWKVSCILSYIVLSRNLKLNLSDLSFFPPFISNIPFSLFHSNMNNFMSFLKLRNAMELLISYSFAFFFVSVIIFSVYHSWLEASLDYVWSWVAELNLKVEVQIKISHSGGKYWNGCFFLVFCFHAVILCLHTCNQFFFI